jgi:hypothetical protein
MADGPFPKSSLGYVKSSSNGGPSLAVFVVHTTDPPPLLF